MGKQTKKSLKQIGEKEVIDTVDARRASTKIKQIKKT